jgi:hypothetical protein
MSCCACSHSMEFQTWQGSELQLEFEVREFEEGQPLDLTGCTATCVLKQNKNDPEEFALVTLTTENGGVKNDTPYLGTLLATFTGDATAELEASSYGCPSREYWSQFAVRLSTNQVVRSALYKVTLFAGTAMAPAELP